MPKRVKLDGWKCEKCGHFQEEQFVKCPKCGYPYGSGTVYVSKPNKTITPMYERWD